MRIKLFMISVGIILFSPMAFSQPTATLNVNVNAGKEIISKDIYGMFSEHLGRDIYDGFWLEKLQKSQIKTASGWILSTL